MLTVEGYDRIRRRVLVEGTSQRQAARELGHSRKTIRKALDHSKPPGYRRTKEVGRPAIDPVRAIIDAWLDGDREAPRKQRHTAKRIWRRLRDEHGFQGGYDSVKRYVAWRQATTGEVYVPLVFEPGEEAQVDWGEAWAEIAGVLAKVFLFCMRLCHSGASFVRAYHNERTEALLDGHVRAFEFFGGVPRRLAYDNPKTIVTSIGRGRERKLTEAFLHLKSHFLFDVRFCNAGRGNEKGQVENLVKYGQRTFMTPVPGTASLQELNDHLDAECRGELSRLGVRSGRTRGELLAEEAERFLALPAHAFEACVRESTIVSKLSLVQFDGVRYSTPVRWAHHPCVVKAFVDRIEVWVQEKRVAAHERSHEKDGFKLDWRHYVPMLERKPGSLENGRPFKGEPWGQAFETMRKELEYRYGAEGTKKFVGVLLLFTEFPEGDVRRAVELCVRRGAYSDEAVRSVLNYEPPRRIGHMDLSHRPDLASVGGGVRPVGTYDALLSREGVPA
jgi:transposase